jgi:hypothetical protein
MEIESYNPTEKDKEKNLHFVAATKCFKSVDGKYLIFFIQGEKYRHLKITRKDGKPIHNYMDIQEIKNIVFGASTVAVEIYPRKKELVNGSNTYHLWTWDGIDVPNLKLLPRYH